MSAIGQQECVSVCENPGGTLPTQRSKVKEDCQRERGPFSPPLKPLLPFRLFISFNVTFNDKLPDHPDSGRSKPEEAGNRVCLIIFYFNQIAQ